MQKKYESRKIIWKYTRIFTNGGEYLSKLLNSVCLSKNSCNRRELEQFEIEWKSKKILKNVTDFRNLNFP